VLPNIGFDKTDDPFFPGKHLKSIDIRLLISPHVQKENCLEEPLPVRYFLKKNVVVVVLDDMITDFPLWWLSHSGFTKSGDIGNFLDYWKLDFVTFRLIIISEAPLDKL
jgi:hypothetical protein